MWELPRRSACVGVVIKRKNRLKEERIEPMMTKRIEKRRTDEIKGEQT